MTNEQLGLKPCQCNHDPEWVAKEIEAGRPPQQYRQITILACVMCDGLWDHAVTDQVIANALKGLKNE
jgi:hypothetical protein